MVVVSIFYAFWFQSLLPLIIIFATFAAKDIDNPNDLSKSYFKMCIMMVKQLAANETD